jgi:predicted alternative tryptophan synthase beta-subunit
LCFKDAARLFHAVSLKTDKIITVNSNNDKLNLKKLRIFRSSSGIVPATASAKAIVSDRHIDQQNCFSRFRKTV